MSKKRQVVQVNEERLKMMMAGDIPIKTEPDKDEVTVDKPVDASTQVKAPSTYKQKFLQKPGGTCKRQTTIHIDEINYSNILKILKTTEGISIASFINNVLFHHFETFGDEIHAIQKGYMEQLYNGDQQSK